ncbi:acetyltransferase (GNAT) family protein [Flavobacteriaceae bacterium MAR_2010_72]|nr:acetyltransferase (GNAT) family protein [Flavobacteriaceae bacterium MAR_2010_72]TVZ58106.1 acetyltransferase (GNAT) family protein [Flavobacteriaceae bacterium MAR_2010_105]
MKTVTYHRVSTDEELKGILSLQEQNLKDVLSADDKSKEGFVTLKHSYDMLKRMNDKCAHCIAKYDDTVVGYALSMLQDFKKDIPLLVPMFTEIDNALSEKHINLNYLAMGQICIDKQYRGQGIFRGLYNFMKDELSLEYDALITEVDVLNTRSSQAHKAVGFEVLKNYSSNNQNWELIIWNWK